MNRIPKDERLPAQASARKADKAGIATAPAKALAGKAQQKTDRSSTVVIKINFFIAASFLFGCFFISACENDEAQIDAWTGKKIMVEEGKNIEAY